MNFNEKLMELRKQRGWSQEELGNRLNVTRQTISKWELSQTTPEMDKLVEISQLFDISLDELLNNPRFGEQKGFLPNGNWKDFNHYEYKSKKTIKGIPLVHVNYRRVGIATARGIIAIGNVAIGAVALGGISLGLISVGGLALGLLFALGGFAAGGLAFGGFAAGLIAFGGMAIGGFAVGGGAFGTYAIGGLAKSSQIGMGGYAEGIVAIGDEVKGIATFSTSSTISPADVEAAIINNCPSTSRFVIWIFKKLCGA